RASQNAAGSAQGPVRNKIRGTAEHGSGGSGQAARGAATSSRSRGGRQKESRRACASYGAPRNREAYAFFARSQPAVCSTHRQSKVRRKGRAIEEPTRRRGFVGSSAQESRVRGRHALGHQLPHHGFGGQTPHF